MNRRYQSCEEVVRYSEQYTPTELHMQRVQVNAIEPSLGVKCNISLKHNLEDVTLC